MLMIATTPAVVKPITPADLAAAKMWGIRLPSISAPVTNSWTITEEASALASDSESAANLTGQWFAETTAVYLTRLALEMIEDGDTESAIGLYDATEAEFQTSFDSFLFSIESPASDWLSWLNLCQAGTPVEFAVPIRKPLTRIEQEGYRPSWSFGFLPTIEMDRHSIEILCNGSRPVARPVMSQSDADYRRRQATARMEDPVYGLEDRDFNELVEGLGVLVARQAWREV